MNFSFVLPKRLILCKRFHLSFNKKIFGVIIYEGAVHQRRRFQHTAFKAVIDMDADQHFHIFHTMFDGSHEEM